MPPMNKMTNISSTVRVNTNDIKEKTSPNVTSASTDDKKPSIPIIPMLDLEEEEYVEKLPFVKSEAEKKLVCKINYSLLSLASMIIFLQFIDKSVLSVAAILGLLEETNLTTNQYSWLGSIFYFGFLIYQIPNSYLLQKFPIGRYLGTLLVCWGIVTGMTALAKNFTQLAILRLLLGVFESGTYPALLLIFNTMFRRSEQPACFGFLYLSNGIGIIIGSACLVGIAKMGDVYGISAWKWSYIIWGIVTVVVGILSFFFLVDSPDSWVLRLTEEEKIIMEARIQDNAVVRKIQISHKQYWEAMKEPRLWLVCIYTFCNTLQNGGLVLYGTILVHSLGFDNVETILLQIPIGAFCILYIVVVVLIHRKTKQIILTACFMSLVSITGCLLLAVLPNNAVKLIGYYLAGAPIASYVMIMTMIASTVSGYSKKIFYNSASTACYTLGNFVGPFMIVDSQKPNYQGAMWGYFGANIMVLICIISIRCWLSNENNKKRKNRNNDKNQESKTDVYLNLTDRQDPNFIYAL